MFRKENATPSKNPLSLYRTQKNAVIDESINAHNLQQNVNASIINLIHQYSVTPYELNIPYGLLGGLYEAYGLQWDGMSFDEEICNLLFTANILTPEAIQKETNLLVKWAAGVFVERYKSKENIAGHLHLLLRLTNKHREIDTINFAPFADVLTADQIKEIKIPKPDTKQLVVLLQAIEYRNQGLLAIYEPFLDTDRGEEKQGKKPRRINLINNFITAMDSKDSEADKIEKTVNPILTAMEQQEALFQSIYKPLLEYQIFSEEKIQEEHSREVTTVNTHDKLSEGFIINAVARRGYLGIVKMLVDAGAAVSPCFGGSPTPAIIDAAASGNLELVKFLVSVGADVNQRGNLRYTNKDALTASAAYQHAAIFEYLMTFKNIEIHISALWVALNNPLHKFIDPLIIAFAAKLDNEKDKIAPLPLWLFMDVIAALHDLKNIFFEGSIEERYGTADTLDSYKTRLINRTYRLILDEAKKLPSVLEEKSQETIKQQFLSIVEQQKKALVEKMQEIEAGDEKFFIVPEAWIETYDNPIVSYGQSVFDLCGLLQGAIKTADLLIIQPIFTQFSQHEGTRCLLKNIYVSLVDKVIQTRNHDLFIYFIEANKELHFNLQGIYPTALVAAVRYAQFAEVEWLLKNYKDVIHINEKDPQGKTLLDGCIDNYINLSKKIDHIYWEYEKCESFGFQAALLEDCFKGIGIKAANSEEATKILKSKTLSTLQLLLKAGADIKLVHPDYTPVIDSFNLGAPTFFAPKLVSHGAVEEYKSAPAP